ARAARRVAGQAAGHRAVEWIVAGTPAASGARAGADRLLARHERAGRAARTGGRGATDGADRAAFRRPGGAHPGRGLPRTREVAARRMVLTGLLSAGPAVLTGAVDFRELSGPRRRVGFLHLLANATGTLCYAASYLARRRGHHGIGRALALAGLAAVGTAGTLGGHLTYAQGVGVYRWQPERSGQRPSEPASRPTTVAGF